MNRLYLCLFIFICDFCLNPVLAQDASVVSSPIFIKIAKGKPLPPNLEITDFKFSDANGNLMIDGDETTRLQFNLKNVGKGKGYDLVVQVVETTAMSGLKFNTLTSIGDLDTGKNININIPITGEIDLKSSAANFLIKVIESNGFGTDPMPIEVQTQVYKSPSVKIVDYSISSQNSAVIEKKKPFDVQALVQNLGQGTAREVTVKLILPANTFCISTNELEKIGELRPGEQRMLNYTIVANNDYNADKLPFEFQLSEKHGRYSEQGKYTVAMNQSVTKEKIKIQGIDQTEVKIAMASLVSDVDKNIPAVEKNNANRVALIIGNEDYSQSVNAQINVAYAARDAQIFKEYAENIMGIERNNIFFFNNTTAGVMKREIDRVSKLVSKMGPESELVFYYAGHGFPDEKTKIPYLIPVDVNSNNLTDAVSLKDLYSNFGNTGAAKVTVFLDACFSGGGREQGILSARGIRIVPEMQQAVGNMVVFAAAKGDQVALPYHDQKHGLFTYFMLKKLKESKGKITYKEMFDYLKQTVGVESIRIAKEQDPVVNYSPLVVNQWEKWTF
jgi:Caspase domain